jgi:hypothetical protein
MADTGCAFTDNLYQVDYLVGSYSGKDTFYQETQHLPDYFETYIMILQDEKSN